MVFVDDVDDFVPAMGMFAKGFAFDDDVVEGLLLVSKSFAKGSDEMEVLDVPPKPELFDEEPKPEELVVVLVVVDDLEGGAPRAAKRLLRSIFLIFLCRRRAALWLRGLYNVVFPIVARV